MTNLGVRHLVVRLGVALIHVYRYLASPWVGNQCRFYPTCSHYAEEALQYHGLLKGCALTTLRLLKCHPWHPGGIDFVPGTVDTSSAGKPEESGETPDP